MRRLGHASGRVVSGIRVAGGDLAGHGMHQRVGRRENLDRLGLLLLGGLILLLGVCGCGRGLSLL
jgi:hypothetical protein